MSIVLAINIQKVYFLPGRFGSLSFLPSSWRPSIFGSLQDKSNIRNFTFLAFLILLLSHFTPAHYE